MSEDAFTYGPAYNAADPEKTKEAEVHGKIRIERELDDLRWVLSEAAGRRVMARLLTESGLHTPGFHGEALAMAAAAGQRDFGLWILQQIGKADPRGYLVMLTERAEEVERQRREQPSK